MNCPENHPCLTSRCRVSVGARKWFQATLTALVLAACGGVEPEPPKQLGLQLTWSHPDSEDEADRAKVVLHYAGGNTPIEEKWAYPDTPEAKWIVWFDVPEPACHTSNVG